MAELFQHFGVDWKLLAAQAVNFGILLFVLWKFAYRPIISLLKKRREEIEKGLTFTKDAEKRLAHAEESKEQIMKGARQEALLVMQKAEEDSRLKGQSLLLQSQEKVDALIGEAKHAVETERSTMHSRFYEDAGELVTEGVRRVLKELPQEVRDRHLVEEALRELKNTERHSKS